MQNEVILYFVDGMTPTKGELAEAAYLRAQIRNARLAAKESAEPCTSVAGPAVPENYADKQRVGEEAKPDADSVAGPDASQPPSIHEMTVKQLRAYAGEHSIQLPAQVNTKEEIIAHVEQHLG